MTLRSVFNRRKATDPSVACHAPFTSLFLDQHGSVRACCMNDWFPLGNVRERTLSEIWRGDEATALRRAMEAQDLTRGCDFCEWQVAEGRPDLAFLRWFEDLPVAERDPAWPQQLELALSNTCNLRCVMCNGDWSSAIRSQHEGRPPLPVVYDDRFFEDLRAFVPHLRRVKFLGGEPLLAGETLRVLELLVELGVDVRGHVTTNGTVWSPRVERILDLVPVDVAVSMDAATSSTYERVRVGASWDVLQRNLGRFCEKATERDTDVTLTYCLMTVNWHEFADFCRFADERDLGCAVNTVTTPGDLSLYRLEPDALAAVIDDLGSQGDDLTRSRPVWQAELDRLRAHLDDRLGGREVRGLDVRRQGTTGPGSAAGR